jgi:hypothetical protein
MSPFTRKTVLALLASLTLITISTASASSPQRLLLNPGPNNYELPRFGFSSFNINGFGERVTNVRWGSIAERMGLESGDTILSLNGFPLRYQGSWKDALRDAVYNGGYVRLKIRDVRTGFIATRETYLDGCGPIVAHSHASNYHGPVTHKTKTMPHDHSQQNLSGPEKIKNFVELFNKKNKP